MAGKLSLIHLTLTAPQLFLATILIQLTFSTLAASAAVKRETPKFHHISHRAKREDVGSSKPKIETIHCDMTSPCIIGTKDTKWEVEEKAQIDPPSSRSSVEEEPRSKSRGSASSTENGGLRRQQLSETSDAEDDGKYSREELTRNLGSRSRSRQPPAYRPSKDSRETEVSPSRSRESRYSRESEIEYKQPRYSRGSRKFRESTEIEYNQPKSRGSRNSGESREPSASFKRDRPSSRETFSRETSRSSREIGYKKSADSSRLSSAPAKNSDGQKKNEWRPLFSHSIQLGHWDDDEEGVDVPAQKKTGSEEQPKSKPKSKPNPKPRQSGPPPPPGPPPPGPPPSSSNPPRKMPFRPISFLLDRFRSWKSGMLSYGPPPPLSQKPPQKQQKKPLQTSSGAKLAPATTRKPRPAPVKPTLIDDGHDDGHAPYDYAPADDFRVSDFGLTYAPPPPEAPVPVPAKSLKGQEKKRTKFVSKEPPKSYPADDYYAYSKEREVNYEPQSSGSDTDTNLNYYRPYTEKMLWPDFVRQVLAV